VVLQWLALLWDVVPLGWSPAASPASRLSWTLQTQIRLLPPLLCCAVPSRLALDMCSQPVHAPTCSLIICFMDVHVQAVLAAKASHVKEMQMFRELCLLLCPMIASTLGWKQMALHGMFQLSPELATHTAIKLSWICDSSFSGACFHGPGAVFSQLPHTVLRGLVADLAVPVHVCAVPWCDSSCPRELSTPHLPALLLFH